MQNIQFFPFWESQRTGRGEGVKSVGPNSEFEIPNFGQKFVLEASLLPHYENAWQMKNGAQSIAVFLFLI